MCAAQGHWRQRVRDRQGRHRRQRPRVVDGDFVSGEGDIVKIMNGGIKINGGGLQSVGSAVGTTFTSLRDNLGLPACHSVFIPDACPTAATNDDWYGVAIDGADSAF